MPKIRRSFHARNRSPIRAAIRPAICSQFRAESARLPGPLSRTIGATMQPAPSTPSTQPHVLALRLRGEKPHQGLRSKNPAPYRVRNRCNLRNALGLREAELRNRVRSRCSGEQYDSDLGLYYLRARYYNPNTGRFMSRDPEAGNRFSPASLHKYLYAGGDPVNRIDPSGRAGVIDYRLALQFVVTSTAAVVAYRQALICLYGYDTTGFYSWAEVGLHGDTGSATQVSPCLWLWNNLPHIPTAGTEDAPFIPEEVITAPGSPWDCDGDLNCQAPCPEGSPSHYQSLHFDPGFYGEPPHWDWRDCNGMTWKIYVDGSIGIGG